MDLGIWKAKVLRELERRRSQVRQGEQASPVTKIELADAVGYEPQKPREHRKRVMRRVCEALREDGKPIGFDSRGCWLARNAIELQRTYDYLRTNGLANLGAAAALKPMQAEASGQTALFDSTDPTSRRHV